MSVKEEVKYFVNQPVGGIIPDDKLPSDYVRVGSYVEPKIGCCDNGNKTREDRVILVQSEWKTCPFSNRPYEWSVFNRRGETYTHMDREQLSAIIDKLIPLRKLGFRVFDCGFFPQGKRAGDLVIYGVPMERYHEGIRTYTEMREVMERYYHVYLDKRVIYQFEALMENKNENNKSINEHHEEQKWIFGRHYPWSESERLPQNRPVHLRDHSNGRVTTKGMGIVFLDPNNDPYWWDLQDKADPQVYILPAWEPGPYLDTLWRAMKECPETTYEGMVIKPANQGQFYTHDKPSSTWMKIRNR
jgi:hypothetical protein